ncbi:unnamed protein product [Discosporangium mesarthrocarpum]
MGCSDSKAEEAMPEFKSVVTDASCLRKSNLAMESDHHSSPKLGVLTPGGRRASIQTRAEPALPLSPSSRLRARSLCAGQSRDVPLGWTNLHFAAEIGDLNMVVRESELSKGKIDKLTTDSRACTALWLACSAGRTEIVKYLLEKCKACPSIPNRDGKTPLHAASQWGRTAIVQLLLAWNTSLEAKSRQGETPLFTAVANGQFAVAELLLDSMASLKVKNKDGQGLLWAAACNGNKEVMDLLLFFKSKFDIEDRDPNGQTPLYVAANYGHIGAVDSLAHKGADINAEDANGTSPLWISAYRGHVGVVAFLLEKGATVGGCARGKMGEIFEGGVSNLARQQIRSHLEQYITYT